MDYKSLLSKYIKHVGEEEGVDFISRCSLSDSTLDEIEALVECSRQATYTATHDAINKVTPRG
jgi:hypothetical protein